MYFLKFDERAYPATLFACAIAEGGSTNTSNMEIQFRHMFQKLYDYLQGQNSKGVTMKMTLPVFSFMHLNKENITDKIAMCFWMTQEDEV